jgi:hypothetical protein
LLEIQMTTVEVEVKTSRFSADDEHRCH